jgi:anti-sigma factor RsiW
MTSPEPHDAPNSTGSTADTSAARFLRAFADGELDVEQSLRVLEHLAQHPRDTRVIAHQQQLRQALERVLRAEAPAPPQALRDRLETLASLQLRDDLRDDAQGPRTRRWRWTMLKQWTPALAAAVLLAASLTWTSFFLPRDSTGGLASGLAPGEAVVMGVRQAAVFQRRHGACSQDPSQVHSRGFPQQPDAVTQELMRVLHTPTPPPVDLRGAGFELVVAGRCVLPGRDSVHLVFRRSRADGMAESLSVWMTPYRGQGELPEGRVLCVTSDRREPVLVWRQGEVVCYVVAESDHSAWDVSRALRGA